MRAFFDTSVLVAAIEGTHIHHEASVSAISIHPAGKVVGAHALAEVYATLSGRLKRSPEHARLAVERVRREFEVVELTVNEYLNAIAQCAEMGIRGAAVYDSLHARCAVKAGVGVLYTWNIRDFVRLGPDVAGIVRRPEVAGRA